MEDITPLARDDILPATFVTPNLTLSLTSSKSGVCIPEYSTCGLPNKSADDMLVLPSNWHKFILSSFCKSEKRVSRSKTSGKSMSKPNTDRVVGISEILS